MRPTLCSQSSLRQGIDSFRGTIFEAVYVGIKHRRAPKGWPGGAVYYFNKSYSVHTNHTDMFKQETNKYKIKPKLMNQSIMSGV